MDVLGQCPACSAPICSKQKSCNCDCGYYFIASSSVKINQVEQKIVIPVSKDVSWGRSE